MVIVSILFVFTLSGVAIPAAVLSFSSSQERLWHVSAIFNRPEPELHPAGNQCLIKGLVFEKVVS
jgi:hypothetical protein